MTTSYGEIQGWPDISGDEEAVARTAGSAKSVFVPGSSVNFGQARAACAVALHMHQPLIPAGSGDLQTAEIISNLQHMMQNQHTGDNHNAPVFHWCYKRMGEIIPRLAAEGCEPRVMLDYSGTLWHGLAKMGLTDVLDTLRNITCDPAFARFVEWLGTSWGHAVAPSTPAQDFRLHVLAWQHHFASIFGAEALARVKGFSPSEMALPNHPDVAYEYVKTLRDCGYRWVLVQEHTVENPETGGGIEQRHLPHRLVCRSSRGETAEILAIIKTQGSDTKLVAQMQPWYEAKSLQRWVLAGKSVPPLVTQIADGENGGVMMNEFPPKYEDVVRQASGSDVPLLNATEYLEFMSGLGIRDSDYPRTQPVMQKRIWDRMKPGDGPERLAKAMEEAKQSDGRFHMEGGSWTNNISWVQGYDNLLGPMDRVSVLFNKKILARNPKVPTGTDEYRRALYHLLCSQTSCYRYWGQGLWTDYGREICRRAEAILTNDF